MPIQANSRSAAVASKRGWTGLDEKTIESKPINPARCVKQRTNEVLSSEEVEWLRNIGASKENLNFGYRDERRIFLPFSTVFQVKLRCKLTINLPALNQFSTCTNPIIHLFYL